jgi:uncharacterized membrane protein YjgN (DUF898 family)
MLKFLELEGGYLVIALLVILVTLFVTTRPFMSKGALKKGVLGVVLFFTIAIGLHFKITTDRMNDVKNAFLNNQKIICESRARRKVAQTVLVEKQNEWQIEGDLFVSPNYSRAFHSARCIVK